MDAPTVLLRNEIQEFSNAWCDYSVEYMPYIKTIPAFLVRIRKWWALIIISILYISFIKVFVAIRNAEYLYVQHKVTFEE